VEEKQWKVRWDEPNYKADSNGVSETVEYFNKIRREDPGAGTGPNSPNARQRYVPGPSLPHASSTFFLPLALGRLAELLNFGLVSQAAAGRRRPEPVRARPGRPQRLRRR